MNDEALIRAQRYMAMSQAYATLAQGIKYPTTVAPCALKAAQERIEVTAILLNVANGKPAAESVKAAL